MRSGQREQRLWCCRQECVCVAGEHGMTWGFKLLARWCRDADARIRRAIKLAEEGGGRRWSTVTLSRDVRLVSDGGGHGGEGMGMGARPSYEGGRSWLISPRRELPGCATQVTSDTDTASDATRPDLA